MVIDPTVFLLMVESFEKHNSGYVPQVVADALPALKERAAGQIEAQTEVKACTYTPFFTIWADGKVEMDWSDTYSNSLVVTGEQHVWEHEHTLAQHPAHQKIVDGGEEIENWLMMNLIPKLVSLIIENGWDKRDKT